MQISYLKHLFTAKGPDRIHSPFVFDLYYLSLLGDFYPYKLLEIEKTLGNPKLKKQEAICLKTLYVLVNKFKPQSILSLGTDALKNALHTSSIEKFSKSYYIPPDQESIKDINKENLSPINSAHEISPEMLVFSSAVPLDTIDFSQTKLFLITHLYKIENRNLWIELTKKAGCNVLLDCYFFGIGFYKANQVSEYFRLRF